MSLIEKATARLDALKRAAGEFVDQPETGGARSVPAAPSVPSPHGQDGRPGGGTVVAPPARGNAAAPPRTENPISRMVAIDMKRLVARGMVTPDLPRSRIAEEFRLIKRPLLKNATATGASAIENGSLIMVTSALPGEGKSFTAINLSISMAMELDYRILLVDADVARPSVLTRLGVRPQRGLLDVLGGEVEDLSDVLLRTNIDKLTLLPAGMPHARATEMLASDAMARLLEQVVRRYPDRIVIFDSPPLLVTTESRVLATHMGQIIIVIEAEKTTHGTVKHALATIESCPVKLLVLNKSREEGRGSYGYGYKYGYGYGTGNSKSRHGKSKSGSKGSKDAR